MSSVCLYFHVHQPHRVKRYSFFDIGEDHNYFNDESECDLNNAKVLRKVAGKCYLPANQMWLELLQKHPGLKIAFSISGTALDQFEQYAPEVLESFQKLVATGQVELISETYYHSLAFLRSPREFREQVGLHRQKLYNLFGVVPKVFRNTELIYRNDIAQEVADLGYIGMLTEGWDHYLGWRSPNFVYHAKGNPDFKLLLKNYKLSDDTAFRFSEKGWVEYPLTAPKFAQWVSATNGNGNVVNLFMDYETIGEHHWEDTGIFDFWRAFPEEHLKHPDNDFVSPSEAIERYEVQGEYDVPYYLSWADVERDISAWMSNPIQHDALRVIYDMEDAVRETEDAALLEEWRKLQTSDHFYYMCTKWFADGDVHTYFSPYNTPYEAFIAYMNVTNDFKMRVDEACARARDNQELKALPLRRQKVKRSFGAWKDRLRRWLVPEYH